MQIPENIIKHDIDVISKSLFTKDNYKIYLKKYVVLYEVKQFDENFYTGIICRLPDKKLKFQLFERVFFSNKSIMHIINKDLINNLEHELIIMKTNRIFRSFKDISFLKDNFKYIQIEKLYKVIFELSFIDLDFLYFECVNNLDINKHKKTKDSRLLEILNMLSSYSLSNNNIPLLINIIREIYIKIKIKKGLKGIRGMNSNEMITKVLKTLNEYNLTKRKYKPIESFNKRLIELNIDKDFFNELTQTQGRMKGRFNKKIEL